MVDDGSFDSNSFWRKVRKTMGKVPFVREAITLYFCATDSRTPLTAKLTAYAALAYFVSPLDAVPDAIPVLGFSDDAAVIYAAIRTLAPYITAEHKKKATDWLS
jgi:uncharacterized membrane protein YkvA (DUF1232 family)